MDLCLQDKTAIVTGGSRGIGKAIARELAGEGVDVVIASRTIADLEITASDIAHETGRQVIPIVVDTGDDESVKHMVSETIGVMGRIDILVNCAAKPASSALPPKLSEVTDQYFWDDVNIKVLGYLRCAREVAPYMVEQGWGRIINVSGLLARQANSIVGSIRNVSLVAMTKNLADELGPRGVNVTVVHPGMTWTEKTPSILETRAESLNVPLAHLQQQMSDSNSIRKFVDARDIAYVACFLASPKSVSINGDVIAAGGGIIGQIYY